MSTTQSQNTAVGQLGASGAPDQNDTTNNYDTRIIAAAEAGDTLTQLPARIIAAAAANGNNIGGRLQPYGAAPNDTNGPLLPPPAPLRFHYQQQQASELPLTRRHELLAAAAADPALALVFSANTEQPVPPVSDLDGRLDKLLKQYGLGEEAVRAVVSLKAVADVKQRAHVALTCVLDRSGSMSGERIALVRETCHFLIDQLTPDDYLGIVSYSGGVRADVPLLRMTPAARGLAHAMVDALEADGSTALYDGLVAGVRQQMEAEAPTDQHVTVHTFGFGAGHSVELLQAVADAQSGVYYYISCVDDIPSGFGDALGGLLAVVAKDVRVGVRAAPGINLTAFRSGGRVGNATLSALATQTHSARASIRPRYEFNQEGVATVAGTKQALKQQRIGTSTMASPAMFAEYDHRAKANFRCTTSTSVQAKYSSRNAPSHP
eukprot:XP_001690959.1 predicted protein [Chlamydomonas reinhardtii]